MSDMRNLLYKHRAKAERLNSLKVELDAATLQYGSLPMGGGGFKGSAPTGNAQIEHTVSRKLAITDRMTALEQELDAEWKTIEPRLESLPTSESLAVTLRYHYALTWAEVAKLMYKSEADSCFSLCLHRVHNLNYLAFKHLA